MDTFLGYPTSFWVDLKFELDQLDRKFPGYADVFQRAITAEGKLALIANNLRKAQEVLNAA